MSLRERSRGHIGNRVVHAHLIQHARELAGNERGGTHMLAIAIVMTIRITVFKKDIAVTVTGFVVGPLGKDY